jgi:hypothetical protein
MDGVATGPDGSVGAEIVGIGGRMSEPYVGNEPMGAAGAEVAAAAGPAKYGVPESVTAAWLLTDGAAVAGGASTAGAVARAVAAGTSDTGG